MTVDDAGMVLEVEMVGRVLLVVVGVAVVVWVLDAAIRTFVLPRAAPVKLTRWIARVNTKVFGLIGRPAHSYERRDKVMALYGPVTLLTLPAAWLVMILLAFAAIFVGVDGVRWATALRYSGSALFTLGFSTSNHAVAIGIVFVEAAIGLALLALLISYLPTIYGAFSKREVAVTRLSVRAGTPPTPAELLIRAHRAGFTDRLDEMFEDWELWFVELEETHTSLVILNFFRSPNPGRSWVTAAGAVLDTAALRYAVLDIAWTPSPAVCIRAGFLSLRAVADYFKIPYDADPGPHTHIAIAREEFDAVFDQIAAAGVPVKSDRDQAWLDYSGWRVNYDTVLLSLADLTMAPYAPWVSDRSPVLVPR
jgi:hypothetical protein